MRTDQLLESLSNCLTIDTASGNLYVYGNLQQEAVKSAVLYADSNGKIIAAPAGVGIGGATSIGAADLTATGTRNNTTYLRGDNTWATINVSGYQPLDDDLTAIAGLADSSGLLRKVDATPSWVIDTAEYMTIEASDGRYVSLSSKRNSLVANNTSLYYSVTAVNNALADKMNISGGEFTGDLTIHSSDPSLVFNDNSSGGVFRFMITGGQFYLKYGTTTPTTLLTVNSAGAFTLESTITSSGFKTPTGTAAQFLKANGTIDSTSYQPLDADLTAIAGLADSSGLLRKVDATPSWVIDSAEYMTIEASDARYESVSSKRNSIVPNSTALYYSVTAVNNALATKMGVAGGTFEGDLNIQSSYPSVVLNDISSGGVYRIMVDGGQFYLKYGTGVGITSIVTINSSGNITANAFVKSGGTSSQFLKADGSVDSATYVTSSALSSYLPLTGGTLTGNRPIQLDTGGGAIIATGNSGGWSMGTYYKGSDNVIKGGFGAYGGGSSLSWLWIGVGYDNTWAQINSSAFNTQVALQQNGNQVLHAGNYGSYAVPLSGGTTSGTITASFDNNWGFRMNRSTTSNYLGVVNATGGTNNWFVGQREDGTNHYRIYNFQSTVNALSVYTDGNIQPYGWMRMGVFNQGQSNGGEAWIGRAADRSVGIMTVQLGGSSSGSRFEVVDYAWSVVLFKAEGNGNVTASGAMYATSFFETSDNRLKTLIKENYQAKGIESITAKLYTKNGVEELGYYAQDVEAILPSAVSAGDNGYLNLSYREVHTAKIARLEKEVEELKAQLARL